MYHWYCWFVTTVRETDACGHLVSDVTLSNLRPHNVFCIYKWLRIFGSYDGTIRQAVVVHWSPPVSIAPSTLTSSHYQISCPIRVDLCETSIAPTYHSVSGLSHFGEFGNFLGVCMTVLSWPEYRPVFILLSLYGSSRNTPSPQITFFPQDAFAATARRESFA